MSVNLKEKPFYLEDRQIDYILNLLNNMSLDEKIGQLFIHMHGGNDPEEIRRMCDTFHISGIRWRGGSLDQVRDQNRQYLQNSRIPVLIAANCEAGGDEIAQGGTAMASGAACAASQTLSTVRKMAEVCASEAQAVVTNWVFGPVCDILMNHKNTIVNTRSYGSDLETVRQCSLTFFEIMKSHGIACAAKHFPGDGVDDRDQHLVMGCNDLSVEEWDRSFGTVYRSLIDAGLQGIMTGHICLPSYSRKLCPGIRENEILPATLAPELLQGLLRQQLGFNGVIITDASHMGGFCAAVSRREGIPKAIEAGCDMILFFNNPQEDVQYIKDGLLSGILSEERLEEAVLRVLALKASLGLLKTEGNEDQNTSLPDVQNEAVRDFGSPEHHALALQCAQDSISLVKDTQHLLPLRPSQKPRCLLYFVESAPVGRFSPPDPAKQILIEELEAAGFQVTAPKNFYELEREESTPLNIPTMMYKGPMETFKKQYDFVLLALHMQGYAQSNNIRVTFSVGHSVEIPWYVHELPTLGVSFQYTNHLYDVPMLKTFINAYMPTREYIHAFVEKMTGKSPFQGRNDEVVWCGRWDTRL